MKTFEVAGANIAAEEFDNEYVVLDLANGHYFSLAGITALVWRGLVDGHSVEALCEGLGADNQRQALVRETHEELLSRGLLRESETAASPVVPIAELAGLMAAAEPEMQLDMFDDLADLLKADPIHDVDENAGWPHRPADAE